jgi:hypothetical protein
MVAMTALKNKERNAGELIIVKKDLASEEDRVNSDTDVECECDGECWNCIYEDECNQE